MEWAIGRLAGGRTIIRAANTVLAALWLAAASITASGPADAEGGLELAAATVAQSEAEGEEPAQPEPKPFAPTNESGDDGAPRGDDAEPAADEGASLSSPQETYPEIHTDLSGLPFPVRRMRELILEAAHSGDIEQLRPLIGYGDDVTMLSLGGIEEDPIGFLKTLSGDEAGHEILAILIEVLEAGYVIVDEGSEHEIYAWPYFFAWPLDRLSPEQRVELFQLVTFGDYEDMVSFGAYIFYRVGITPEGRWRFFVAGD